VTSLKLVLAASAVLAAAPLLAQERNEPGAFLFAKGGGYTHLANLNDTGTADFKTGLSLGAGGGYLFNENLALRSNFHFIRAEARTPVGIGLNGTKFNRYLYDADLQLRYPTDSGIAPYVFAGGGVINVHQDLASDPPSFTKGAGKVGLGLEYRLPDSNVGLYAEGTGWLYKWDRHGFNKTQFDTTWMGGLAFHFPRK
jgi:opacity protein-like surface antigen